MALTDELKKLHELQKIDSEIYQREQTLKALDSGETLKQEAIALLKRHDAAVAALQKAEAAQRNSELELKGIESKRATVHEKLYSGRVNNPKELGDLQKDEEMLDTQIGSLEEKLLELMDVVTAAKTVQTTLAGELSAAKRRWQQTVAHTQAETARLQQELTALRPERQRLAALVTDKMLLSRYDGIRQRHAGIGLAVTQNNLCPACHVTLNSQVLLRLHEGVELTVCENCGRLLAWLE
ncbi:MAG: zinc ribbon domain-containing protein [Armatimonadota bacterium]